MEGRVQGMAKPKSYRLRERPQAYDSTLKEWVQRQPEVILPLILPNAVYKETLDVERIKPTMRVDRVYKIMYRGKDHILHLEFESGADNDMTSRLLVYHAILYKDYHLPVISIIIYPFRVTMATPPFREMSGEEEILKFKFGVLPLFKLDAERYIQEHRVAMYPLLPAMRGANRELIDRAMDELAELYREDEVTLSQQLVWMELLLERADTVPLQEKEEVQRRLSML
jgi:hypothetical protein